MLTEMVCVVLSTLLHADLCFCGVQKEAGACSSSSPYHRRFATSLSFLQDESCHISNSGANMTRRTLVSSALATLAFILTSACVRARQGAVGINPLPANASLGNGNAATFSVSGVGAGACMALQFQYAWSSIVHGAALIGAAPYLCAAGTLAGAEACLNTPWIEAPAVFFASAVTSEAWHLIDDLSGLQNQTIFLFSGTDDTVVPQPNMDNVNLMYQMAGAGARVTTFFNYSAEHAWVTSKYGNACDYLGTPWVNNCGVDFAGAFFEQLWHDTKQSPPWNATAGPLNASHLYSFDQTQFGANPSVNSLDTVGFVYLPDACLYGEVSCSLHVNLHGCHQYFGDVGTTYMLQTQLNEHAESNNIVILYPEATASTELGNPLGCFDWWAYAGEDYALKSGPQITAIRAMIEYFGGF